MNIKENMISLLERCTTALKEGSEMYADNLTAICALASSTVKLSIRSDTVDVTSNKNTKSGSPKLSTV